MKLSDLNKRQRKVIEAFQIHVPVGPYVDSGKFHGAGKGTIKSLVDMGIIEFSDKYCKYKLTESGLRLLN